MVRSVLLTVAFIAFSQQALALSKAEVRAIVEAEYPGARISEIDKEKYQGNKVYEVDFRHGGKKLEAIISLDGAIIKVDIDD